MKLPKSKYKGITAYQLSTRSADRQDIYWQAQKSYKGEKKQKNYIKTEREAALAYDKMCLSFGLEPVNILVRK